MDPILQEIVMASPPGSHASVYVVPGSHTASISCLRTHKPSRLPQQAIWLFGSIQVGTKVSTLFVFFDASKDHLRPRHVLLRVDQILKHVFVGPFDARIFVCFRVAEAIIGASCASHDTPKWWALLRIPALFASVALSTLCLEQLRSLLDVTLRDLDLWLRNGHCYLLPANDWLVTKTTRPNAGKNTQLEPSYSRTRTS